MRVALGLLAIASLPLAVAGQSPATTGPAFEVVSVNLSPAPSGDLVRSNVFRQRPDGGLTVTRMFIVNLIARAYAPLIRFDIVGLPDWASRDF